MTNVHRFHLIFEKGKHENQIDVPQFVSLKKTKYLRRVINVEKCVDRRGRQTHRTAASCAGKNNLY